MVTSPPRLTPFEADDGLIIFDDFQRPNGPLIGTAAPVGGTWQASPAGYAHPAIVSHAVPGANGVQMGSVNSRMLTPEEFQNDWWASMVVTPTVQEAGSKAAGVWVGDETGAFFGLLVDWQIGVGGAGEVELTGGNIGAPELLTTVPIAGFTVSHEFVFQWIAATQTINVLIDGVQVATATAVALPTVINLDFTLYINLLAITLLPVMHSVEFGSGVYV